MMYQQISPWLVCQIGAREHYSVARALRQAGLLDCLITDSWCPPGAWVGRLPGAARLVDRFHEELATSDVSSFTNELLFHNLVRRVRGSGGADWSVVMGINRRFQELARSRLSSIQGHRVLFSYSYAAHDLLLEAGSKGWATVVGQIDPGPEEERIVAEEHRRYPQIRTSWEPAPIEYWDHWRREMDYTDRVMVNSSWSRTCLERVGIPQEKIVEVPLAFKSQCKSHHRDKRFGKQRGDKGCFFDILFLGQVNLRKGVARLIEAMRILENHHSNKRIRLTLAGAAEVDSSLWKDLSNVRWIGPLSRSETDSAYSKADAFVLPSLSDGFAITQLEALAHGLPVIVSKNCGKVVTHGVNGWVLDDLEPETIADSIVNVAEHPHLRKPVKSAPGFSIEEIQYRLAAIF